MKKSTKNAVNKTIDEYEKDLIDVSTTIAINAHIAGDLEAIATLGLPVLENRVQAEAIKYGQGYRTLLQTEGASIIQGKKIAWLDNQVESTRDSVYAVIENGLQEGKPVASIGGKLAPKGTIAYDLQELATHDKAYEYTRIARTETARIQNQGTLNRYKLNGITHVNVIDGTDFDEACAEANGQVWTVEYAQAHELEHPNCTRTFSPVVPDDWEPPADELVDIPVPDGVGMPKDIDALAADAAMKEHMKAIRAANPVEAEEMLESVKEYTYMEFQDMNEALRDRDTLFRYNVARRIAIKKNIENTSKFLQSAPKVEGTVYRGMNFDSGDALETFMNQLRDNDTIIFKSFTSTSTRRTVAEDIISYDTPKSGFSALFELRSKNGVYLGDASAWKAEREVLFNAGSKFLIESVSETTPGAYKIIMNEVVL